MTNNTQQATPELGFAVKRDGWRALGLGASHDAAIGELMHESPSEVARMRKGHRPSSAAFVAATLGLHPGAFNELFSICHTSTSALI